MTSPTTGQNFAGQALAEFRESGVTNKIFIGMLALTPLAVLADFSGFPPLLIFFIAALAVVPLAKTMSDSTEALAHHVGPTIGGLLVATFGNAVELIIAVLALLKGLNEVVKASIAGSIIGNLLFVLGLSMFMGGLKRKNQTFSRVGASVSSSQLVLAAIALIIPAVFTSTLAGDLAQKTRDDLLENLSILVAIILLICYAGQLIFFLFTHADLSGESGKYPTPAETTPDDIVPEEEEESVWSVRRAVITLVVATIVVGYVSEILVGSIEPVTKQLGWTELFVGVILLAIVGNAAEYVASVSAAMKNRMNLSLNITTGASLQMAFFVTPVLVFFGLIIGNPLSLRFEEFELVCIIVAVLIVNLVSLDGESNWLEGLQLMGAYFIIAVAFFLHP
jgi:Ca2+:H+ antiporter